ncbi:MAG: FAD:protein FMN transferase, partial [Myxococcota bacterium]
MKSIPLSVALTALLLTSSVHAQEAPAGDNPENPQPSEKAVGDTAEAPTPVAEPEAEAAKSSVQRFGKKALGTDVEILVYTADASGAKSAADAAFAEIERIDGLMSAWNAQSEINRLNASAGGEPVAISADTTLVLELAKRVSRRSQGAFASTWATLSGLWNFEIPEGQAPIVPDTGALEERMKLVDDDKLVIGQGTAQLAQAGMAVGLGGITKGHAVDRALAVMVEKGFADVLVFVGGDIASTGRKGASPWVVGLQEPRSDGHFAVITLDDEAIATSGDYEAYFELDGKRYHHLLDPRTGYPAFGTRSVSVVAKDAASADAYATAIFVLGPVEGLELAEKTEGLEAVIVDADNQVTVSTGL